MWLTSAFLIDNLDPEMMSKLVIFQIFRMEIEWGYLTI